MTKCEFCTKELGRRNKSGLCGTCQKTGEHYPCARVGCTTKITHSRHRGTGYCAECFSMRKAKLRRAEREAIAQEQDNTTERDKAGLWPLGRPRGWVAITYGEMGGVKVTPCPLAKVARDPDVMRAGLEGKRRGDAEAWMLAGMIRAGVPL